MAGVGPFECLVAIEGRLEGMADNIMVDENNTNDQSEAGQNPLERIEAEAQDEHAASEKIREAGTSASETFFSLFNFRKTSAGQGTRERWAARSGYRRLRLTLIGVVTLILGGGGYYVFNGWLSEKDNVGSARTGDSNNDPFAGLGMTTVAASPGHEQVVFVILEDITEENRRKAVGPNRPNKTGIDIFNGIRSVSGDGDVLFTNHNGDTVRIEWIVESPFPDKTLDRLQDKAEGLEPVLAVGHVTSTTARTACEKWYQREGIPVILVGPTNPEITRDAAERRESVILRLLRTDDYQIMEIISATQTDDSIVVRLLMDKSFGSRVLATFDITATDARAPEIHSFLKEYRPEALVFVGMTERGIAMVRSLENLARVKRRRFGDSARAGGDTDDFGGTAFVFTDGCASTEFFQFMLDRKAYLSGTKDRTGVPWRSLTLLSPVPPYTEAGNQRFDYENVGVVAGLLARQLLTDAARGNGNPTRQAVLESLKSKYKRKVSLKEPPASFRQTELLTLVFDEYGDNSAWAYYQYKLVPSGIKAFKDGSPVSDERK